MNKKYELLQNDTKIVFGRTLFRIKAKISFSNIIKGELGGYIETENSLSISGNAWVYGNAHVSGDAQVYGDAHVLQQQKVLTGNLIISCKNISISLMAQIGICLINNKCILYKRVNKISKGKYSSCYNKNFIYQDGKISKVENPDLTNTSCASGIHLSSALYWQEGDTLIACEVKKEDIITIQEGKVRVKACKVIGEVKI